MAARKQESGKWICGGYPRGQAGAQQFATKGEAVAFEPFTMEQSKDVAPFCYVWC
ncbi:hypothetical protein PEC301937_18240 [Pectobacterium carotovorum subsp. carotovorum]|nr:hypothetical protein PEC301937_18240 [Pectobacterium carotovorum subsp. carotovorum]